MTNNAAARQPQTRPDEAIFQLGLLLRAGLPMPEAMRNLATSSSEKKIKVAAARSAELLAMGNEHAEVFADPQMTVFSGRVRYILAAPVSDKLKGALLCDWHITMNRWAETMKAMIYPLQSMAIGFFSCLSLFVFVLPQFREICSGLRIELPPFSAWLLGLTVGTEGSLILVLSAAAILSAGLLLGIYLIRVFYGASAIRDELNFLRMLAAVPANERIRVAVIMSVPLHFPTMHHRFSKFANDFAGGSDINSAATNAGLDLFICWFLNLGLSENADPETLSQGASLLEARFDGSCARAISIIEVCSVLLQGLVFGGVAYAVFQLMSVIMLGSIT